MSKSKKSKKQKVAIFKNIKLTRIIIIGICVLIGFFSTILILKIVEKNSFNVAFYKVNDQYQKAIEELISKSYDGKINITSIDEDKFISKKIAKKYDLFIGWNGNSLKEFESYSKEIPEECKSYLISTVEANKNLPILLNHYENAYNNKNKLLIPQNYNDFLSYLFSSKNNFFIPLCLQASDDDTLLAFISTQIEAICGAQDYLKFTDLVISNLDFDSILDYKFSYSNELSSDVSLKLILDGLLNFSKNDLLPPNWCNLTKKDIQTFTEQNEVSVFFTSLENHRKFDEKIMKYFIADRMPVVSFEKTHGLIAPCLSIVKLSNKSFLDKVLISLVETDNQEILSDETKLAPVNSKSRPYDVQSNDVRFFAACVPSGPLPDIANACFQLNSIKKHEFADKIREYLVSQ